MVAEKKAKFIGGRITLFVEIEARAECPQKTI
jgi:hypothetical protein